jgi:hypothetical protein
MTCRGENFFIFQARIRATIPRRNRINRWERAALVHPPRRQRAAAGPAARPTAQNARPMPPGTAHKAQRAGGH